MGARDGSGDEQPETKSSAPTRVLTARAEGLEHPRQHLRRNAAAVVHLDDDLFRVSGHADPDRRARCSVLNRIGGKIGERLYDAVFVPLASTVDVAFKCDPAVLRVRLDVVNDLSAQIPQIGGPGLDRNALAFTFPREIEEVSDDVLNAVDAAFDHLGVLLRIAAGIGDVLQPARGEQDRAQRIPDVVADNRENPLLKVTGEGQLLLIALLLGILRPAALVDVDTAADESRKVPVVVDERNTAVEYPAIHPVVAAEAIFHFERLAPPEMIQIERHAPPEIVGVDARRPAVAHLFFDRAAREFEPGLVEVVALGVEARAPDHDRRMTDQQTVLFGRQLSTHKRKLYASDRQFEQQPRRQCRRTMAPRSSGIPEDPMSDAHTADDAGAPLPAGTRLGAYEIVARLGAGGMGEVYLANDMRLGRRVALKVLPPALAGDDDRRRRLEREAQAAAKLNHPNIVTLFSFEHADAIAFLTMEYVEGDSLASHIVAAGMPLNRMLPIAIAIADAVAAAHRAGIVHRDLKPANVMLTAPGSRPKVLDFGLARFQGVVADPAAATGTAPISDLGRIVGTIAYMSPEQAEGRETDARSDIFSLGVMLFEMATGRRPFVGDSSLSVISSILRDTPPTVSDVKPGLPVEFARIVRRCLQKDPDRRYQTAVDLRNALEELKQDTESGISAPVVPRIASHGRRRWIPIVAAAGVLVVAGAGWWGVRARSSKPPRAAAIEIRERQVTSNPIDAPVFNAAISADGRYVAYGDINGIHIRFIETGETRTVPVPSAFCFT